MDILFTHILRAMNTLLNENFIKMSLILFNYMHWHGLGLQRMKRNGLSLINVAERYAIEIGANRFDTPVQEMVT